MSLLQAVVVIAAQAAQVAGQLLLKQGMTQPRNRAPRLAAGLLCLAFWFFAWLKLLQGLDLSYLYPFEGLSLVLLVLAARFVLQERTLGWTWIGAALISAGMVLVGLG